MERHEITTRKLVIELPETDVTVNRNLPWRGSDGSDLALDIYRPSTANRPVPAVIFVTGFPDARFRRMVGCNAKDMASYDGWGRLLAASGLAAITYVNNEPAADALAILAHLEAHAAALAIDPSRIGVWACSGNVPVALSLLMAASPALACAVFSYGYMLDLDGSTAVADAAATWRFVNPCAGRGVEDLPADTPMLIARAGRDEMAGLNDSIDRFVPRALALNRPITVINHHSAPHAFDTADASEASRHVIREIVRYVSWCLNR